MWYWKEYIRRFMEESRFIKVTDFAASLKHDTRTERKGSNVIAIELHHLHPSHDDELTRLKAHIAELEKENAELKEERRWRKFSDEKPEEDTWCIVFHDGEIDSDHYTRFAYNNKCDFALYGNEVTHWMPLPSAPKEEK